MSDHLYTLYARNHNRTPDQQAAEDTKNHPDPRGKFLQWVEDMMLLFLVKHPHAVARLSDAERDHLFNSWLEYRVSLKLH